MKNVLRLINLLPDEKRRMVFTVALATLVSAVGAAITYFFKLVVDKTTQVVAESPNTDVWPAILGLLLVMVGLLLFYAVLQFLLELKSDKTNISILYKLRARLLTHLSRLSIDFYDQHRVGEITTRLTAVPRDFAKWISYDLGGFAVSTVTSIFFSTIVLATINLWAALVSIILTPLAIYVSLIKARRTEKTRDKANKVIESAWGTITETISYIHTVRSFANEKLQLAKFRKDNILHRDLRVKQFSVQRQHDFLSSIIVSLNSILGIGAVVYAATKQLASVGDIAAAALYLQRITGYTNPLARLIVDSKYLETDAKRVITILDEQPDVSDIPEATALRNIDSIEFNNVSFKYPNKQRLVLDKLSFKLKQGETLALVGPSGVGKSTIIKLLLRFYDVTSGQVLINGKDIKNYKQDSVRKLMGTVMQDVALFNDTVRENIRFAKPTAQNREVESVAKLAHADVFINRLPKGYQTLVGERGVRLSGGEKQRVAIARAILRNPQLVILDEATSSLDTESERYVQAGLETLLKNRTAVIIAHRLSTVMRADKILVISKGKVVEEDDHESLLKKKGHYAKMFEMQSGGYR